MSEPTGESAPATETPEPKVTATTLANVAEEKDWQAEAEKFRKHSREWESRAKLNATAAEKLAALEESQKTEAQKISERADAAEKRASESERELTRYRVAVEKQLPAELTGRLRGDTPEELAADADVLLKLLKASNSLKPDMSQGNSKPVTGDPAQQFAELLQQARGPSRR